MSARRPARNGFTLVEMLVALAIFGIIAVVATAIGGSAIRSFATSETTLARITRITTARDLLAADLGQAARRPNRAADGSAMPAFTLTPDGFVMVRRGLTGTLPRLEKIAWGHDGERLLRQSFPAIDGAAPGRAVEILPDVQAVRLRVAGAAGWQDRWQPARAEDLPQAVELTLVGRDGIAVTMLLLVAA